MMPFVTGLLIMFSGYLLGSIPSAYIIGRLKGVDLSVEDGDSKLGTSLSFRRLGMVSGLVVGLMDFGKGAMTIAVAQVLDVSAILVLLAGFAAVVGHNWSLFLGFKGGRGAITSYGVLASLAFWGLFLAAVLAGVFFFFTRKSTLATVVLMALLVTILWVQNLIRFLPVLPWEREISPWHMIFPLTLLIPSFLKSLQIRGKKLIQEK